MQGSLNQHLSAAQCSVSTSVWSGAWLQPARGCPKEHVRSTTAALRGCFAWDAQEIQPQEADSRAEPFLLNPFLSVVTETFQFVSKRHHGFPFSLTFFLNGMQVDRLSCCCEYKHQKRSRRGGRHRYFGFLSVEGASPCYRYEGKYTLLTRTWQPSFQRDYHLFPLFSPFWHPQLCRRTWSVSQHPLKCAELFYPSRSHNQRYYQRVLNLGHSQWCEQQLEVHPEALILIKSSFSGMT